MHAFITPIIAATLVAGLPATAMAQSEGAARPSSGCEVPLAAPGDYGGTFEMDDGSDDYWVVVPEGYADAAPVPLVLWLSNASGSADANYAGWRPQLDGIDVLFAIAGTQHRSDPDAMLALIDQLEAEYCIDTRHVHPMGSAWTAQPAAVLSCAASERIASYYAGMGGFEVPDCDPARPVPVLSITGDADRSAVTASIERWVELNGCTGDPLVEELGSGVTRVSPGDCEADVLLYDIEGVGHAFIFRECIGPAAAWCREYAELDQLDEALLFFEDHPLPE
jgi:polyhydroxybutyrate depolymerase